MATMKIREMTVADIDAVLAVEEVSFPEAWTRETYILELTQNNYATYFVIEADGKIIGFCGLWLVIDDAQITNIAILPEYRGYKIGEKLFGYTVQYAIAQGAKQLSLEVRKSNLVAQKLYKKFGLVIGGIRKGYYPDNGEDAIVMWVKLS